MEIVERFVSFFRVLKPSNLEKFIDEQKKSKKEIGYKTSAINVVIVSVISAILTLISLFFIQPTAQKKLLEMVQQSGTAEQIEQFKQLITQQTAMQQSMTIEGVVISLALQVVLFVAYFFILQGLVYYISTFIGGKGTLKKQTYVFSVLYAGLFVILALFPIAVLLTIMVSPLVAIIPMLLYYAALIYGFYLTYKLVRRVHELDMLKGAGVIIVAGIILFWISTIIDSISA